jgi:hypothetical protein
MAPGGNPVEMERYGRVLMAALVLAGAGVGDASAQRLLDWPVRAGVEAEAVVSGAASVFWNPAVVGLLEGRGEALVLDIRGPRAAELNGLAVAAAVKLTARTGLIAGYHHLGVSGMSRTTTSPETIHAELEVGEDVFRLGAARAVGDRAWAGLVVEHWRSGPGGAGSRIGAGAAYRGESSWQPTLAAAAYTGRGSPRWLLGAEVKRPAGAAPALQLGGSYGLNGDGRLSAPAHRGTLTAEWRGRASLSAGVTAEPNGETIHWEPLMSGRLMLGSYALSVTREALPSDFGAAYYFGLVVGF